MNNNKDNSIPSKLKNCARSMFLEQACRTDEKGKLKCQRVNREMRQCDDGPLEFLVKTEDGQEKWVPADDAKMTKDLETYASFVQQELDDLLKEITDVKATRPIFPIIPPFLTTPPSLRSPVPSQSLPPQPTNRDPFPDDTAKGGNETEQAEALKERIKSNRKKKADSPSPSSA